MILAGVNPLKVFVGVLLVSLAVLILVIAYRKLIGYFGKGRVVHRDFCVLHPLEQKYAQGEVEFYFTAERPVEFELVILDKELNSLEVVTKKEALEGGNIIRWDSRSIPDGDYFYQLRTHVQKTMKRMSVKNT